MKNKDVSMSLPTKAKVVIIGGGIHGLSTAWKLSETYKNPGDIVVLEKKDTAAGASGIACGVVRNNYFQPAMRELMALSVSKSTTYGIGYASGPTDTIIVTRVSGFVDVFAGG